MRAWGRFLFGRLAVPVVLATLGCGAGATRAPGQVNLVLETSGGVGTSLSFERIDIVVTDERAKGLVAKTYRITPAELPGTVAIVASGPSKSPTTVEVYATDANGKLRIYQAAKVEIPATGATVLRMKLDSACDGIYPAVQCPGGLAGCAASPALACGTGTACLAGRCVRVQEYGPDGLPPYDAARVGSCVPETDGELCERKGLACGSGILTDSCGAPRVARCGICADDGSATTMAAQGTGLDDCGELSADPCATSPLVPGGEFSPGEDQTARAKVHAFRLDAYEVTVGRFRKFVDAWVGGWRPSAGSGRHSHVQGGTGLVGTRGGTEAGWEAGWTAYVGAGSATAVEPVGSGATTKAEWDSVLDCGGVVTTWTRTPGVGDKRPQNCLSWYDLYAFCIWDGGFLPTEAEWEYAAAGGSEERLYPWGDAAPGADTHLAVHGCYYNATGTCFGLPNIAPVGAAPAGAARWGQRDLAGSIWEWNLDWYEAAFSPTCDDCAKLTPNATRVFRGGSFGSEIAYLHSAYRGNIGSPAFRYSGNGGRCARSP